MAKFKKGDRIVANREAETDGEDVPKGTEYTVHAVEYDGYDGVLDTRVADEGTAGVVWVNGSHFDLVETERVPVAHMTELQVGDVVETAYNRDTLYAYVTRTKPVEPPKPTHGYGTAYVFGHPSTTVEQRRYRGLLSKSGNFYFLSDVGDQRRAHSGQYEDFQPED